jgi:phosphoglycerate kinase
MGLFMNKFIGELDKKEISGKKILLRVDFNVSVSDGKILEKYRIKTQRKTIDSLIKSGAIIGLVSHITAVNSFASIANQVKEILERDFIFVPDCIGLEVENNLKNAKPGDIFLFENVRKYEGEKKNDPEFAKELAKPFDIYINNAFSVCHRNHASLVAITNFLPAYAGPLLVEEIGHLNKMLESPKENKTLIIGGNKIDTKLPVIKNFIDKAEHILIGGVITEDMLEKKFNIIFPKDYISENSAISDIGPETIEEYTGIINNSKIIIWNGPLGKTEEEKFSRGSEKISEAIINSKAFSVVGGGDTVAFLERMAIVDRFNYVSAGGGAMLEFLAGNKLPGLLALKHD